jgi:tight adherence protein C
MSSLYLPLGLLATFAAVVLGVIAVQASLADRRRAVELLKEQVGEMPTTTNLREQQLSEPFLNRVLVPAIRGAGSLAKRVTPIGMRDRIAHQLVLAGSPPGLDAEKIAAAKLFGTAGGAVLGFAVARMMAVSTTLSLAMTIFVALFVYLIPGAGLGQRAIHRQDTIRKAMPDTMDLLTISVEAGMGFDAAMTHVRKNVPGPLSDEIGRMLQEMLQEIQLGVSRRDAFRHLAARTDVEELKGFVLAMVQADIFGISVAKVLRAQAKELRIRRRQRAEELAMKVPIKLLFPLIFCILPSMFVVLLGPGMIRVLDSLFGIRF